jgi:Barstar (barnase inhibitor)
MLSLSLNGASWRTRDDFYDAVFAAVGAPEWHGRNFNALRDSIGTGGVNKVEPPYCIVIAGRSNMGQEAQQVVADFCDLIRELRESGCVVDASFE